MTENEPNDPAMIAGADQAEAATHDLLTANGLEILEAWSFDDRDLDDVSAVGILEALSASAIKAASEGALLAIAAYPIDQARYSRIALVVRRKGEESA